MKKTPVSILCGLAAIIATVVAYFVIIGNIFAQIICFITLLGVVVAQAVTTTLAYLSKGEPRKVAATVVSAFMIPVSVALSIVYIVNFPHGYGQYLGLYFAAFAIILVICAILWKFSDNRKADNDALQSAKSNVLELRKLVKCVMLRQGAKQFKKQLDEIDEKLRFSNDTVITAADENIRRMLIELDNSIDTEDFDAAKFIETISTEIDRRNIFSN